MDENVNTSARIIVCADDYALSPGIGQAVRGLLNLGAISATSCMTTSELWPSEAALLRPLTPRCDAGLHLTLTDQRAAAPIRGLAPDGRLPSLGGLMVAAMSRRLERTAIEDEIERQLDRFEAAMGMPPRFVDGHQHVHQLPVIRDALLAVYERRLRPHGVWLRSCAEPLGGILRRRIAPLRAATISLLGRRLSRRARRAGIPGNDGFRGVRSFTPEEHFPDLMAGFLDRPRDGLLIMCHPAAPDDRLATLDSVVETRPAEYAYLGSEAFAALLRASGTRIVRFGEIAATPVRRSAVG